jgi:hypothetical protein
MRMKLAGFLAGTLVAVSALGATSAAAATEFGSHCTANRAVEGESYAVIQLSQGGVATTAPVSGVVTNWKINLESVVPFSLPQQLKVFRPTDSPSQFQVVGESAMASVASGENTFATRIPIQAGDHIGLFANSKYGALFCNETPESEAPGNSVGFIFGNPTVGSTATLPEPPVEALVPVAAVIEPDADNDGYGDETQDKCPQNAAVQASCPVPVPPVTLSASSIAKKGLATVLMTSNSQAPVTVTGTAKLGKGQTAKLSGGTQIVVPGVISRFTLLFPEKLKAKLKQLSRKRFLWLNLVATAPNSAGAITTSDLKVKLKGQAKPRRHAKAKAKSKGQA